MFVPGCGGALIPSAPGRAATNLCRCWTSARCSFCGAAVTFWQRFFAREVSHEVVATAAAFSRPSRGLGNTAMALSSFPGVVVAAPGTIVYDNSPNQKRTNSKRKNMSDRLRPYIFNGRPSSTSGKVVRSSQESSRELSRPEGAGRAGLVVGWTEDKIGSFKVIKASAHLPCNRQGSEEVRRAAEQAGRDRVGQDASRLVQPARLGLDDAFVRPARRVVGRSSQVLIRPCRRELGVENSRYVGRA